LRAFHDQPLAIYLFNSLAVALISTALTLSSPRLRPMRWRGWRSATKACARRDHRGFDVSIVTLLVPLFRHAHVGILNTYAALVLHTPSEPAGLHAGTGELLPEHTIDLENAAMIDGCSRVGALFRIVVHYRHPVCSRRLLAFVNSWDEFLLALSFTRTSMRTLPVGITLYQGEIRLPLAGDFALWWSASCRLRR